MADRAGSFPIRSDLSENESTSVIDPEQPPHDPTGDPGRSCKPALHRHIGRLDKEPA